MAQRDYGAAVATLNSLQSNFAAIAALKKSGVSNQKQAVPEMIEFYRRIGYTPSDFDQLRPIHIAGTKGKGSTSAFISSILTEYASTTNGKIGLYTSPHLRFVRERIQINNEPLSEELFAKYFFEVWDKLSTTGDGSKPMYFRFLTLMAMHAFICEGVDTAVVECGIGGEHDSTNVFVRPSVTAVTSLGIDHVGMLGRTIEEIAWHKAGIFKIGSPAFTAPQPESALQVLRKRAEEKGTELRLVQRIPLIESGEVQLGLAADFQKTNSSLAVAVAAAHLRKKGMADVPEFSASVTDIPLKFIAGLKNVKWGGRCEKRQDKTHNVLWHLDGGHTLESINLVGRWFAEEIGRTAQPLNQDANSKKTSSILIFNQQTKDRNAGKLAEALFNTLEDSLKTKHPFSHVIFTSNVTFKDAGYKPDLAALNANPADIEALTVQKELAAVWSELDPNADVVVLGTIEEAIDRARQVAGPALGSDGANREVMALVTGSLHLVGGALEVLEST